MDFILDECHRKLGCTALERDGSNRDEMPKDEAQKEIEKILDSSNNDLHVESGGFDIGHEEIIEHTEGQQHFKNEEPESEEDSRKSETHSESGSSVNANDSDKMKANQLFLEGHTLDAELDDMEIDDYLDNLGKSDDES